MTDYRQSEESSTRYQIEPVQWRVFWTLGITMALSVLIWSVMDMSKGGSFWVSGAYFVLIPGTMAAVVAIVPWGKRRTSFGAVRGTMIGVLGSAIVLREGFICVIMALPLIILVVALVSYSVKRSNRPHQYMLIPIVLAGFGGEGVVYDLPSAIVVSESRTIDTESQILAASFDTAGAIPEIEPLLFKLPFPKPTSSVDGGGEVGSVRTVQFGNMGALSMMITERTDSSIRWEVVENSTPLADWMTIYDFSADWVETTEGVEVTITISFDRVLSPAFYFDPLERWGVGELADVMLDLVESNLAETSR